MLTMCNNKGCMKNVEALLDTKTNEVVCPECGKVISNLTNAIKQALKLHGQIVRNTTKKAFMFGCVSCQANREVVMDKSTNKVTCKVCGDEIKIHPTMKQAMIESLKTQDQE